MTRQSLRRLAAGIVAAGMSTALVLLPAAPASAHFVVSQDTAWTSGPDYCSRTTAAIAIIGSPPRPVVEVVTSAHATSTGPGGALVCDDSLPGQPVADLLAATWQLYKWNGTHWTVCASAGWEVVAGTVSHLIREYFPTVPCGEGYYGTMGHGGRYDQGEWRTGSVWSGPYYFGL